MALRHFKDYFRQVEKQYLKMIDDAKEYDKLLKEGKIEQEQVEQVQLMLSKLTENYKRLAYTAYLLQLPNRKKKESKRRNIMIETALSDSDKQSILKENEDILSNFRKQIEESKNG